jgi:hypothetical protein
MFSNSTPTLGLAQRPSLPCITLGGTDIGGLFQQQGRIVDRAAQQLR